MGGGSIQEAMSNPTFQSQPVPTFEQALLKHKTPIRAILNTAFDMWSNHPQVHYDTMAPFATVAEWIVNNAPAIAAQTLSANAFKEGLTVMKPPPLKIDWEGPDEYEMYTARTGPQGVARAFVRKGDCHFYSHHVRSFLYPELGLSDGNFTLGHLSLADAQAHCEYLIRMAWDALYASMYANQQEGEKS